MSEIGPVFVLPLFFRFECGKPQLVLASHGSPWQAKTRCGKPQLVLASHGSLWLAVASHGSPQLRQMKPLLSLAEYVPVLQTHVVASKVPVLQLVTTVALTAQRLQGTHRLSVSE